MDFFTINSIIYAETGKDVPFGVTKMKNWNISPIFSHIGADFVFELPSQSSDRLQADQ